MALLLLLLLVLLYGHELLEDEFELLPPKNDLDELFDEELFPPPSIRKIGIEFVFCSQLKLCE
jgi:hypothetical protein